MLTLVIQAGGESRRMGRDKALVPFLGRPLIERVIRRQAPLADEIIVTTNRPDQYQFLGLPLVSDLLPGRGALGGLYTAISAASQPVVAVVACDMPFASLPLLVYQKNVLESEQVDVVIPKPESGYEPLHTLYRRDTCLPAIKSAIDADLWKVISWFPQVKVRDLSDAEIRACDPDGRAFMNVNTPDELAAAEALARNSDSKEQ